jgi:hypothetical protein
MKKVILLKLSALAFVMVIVFQACNNDDDNVDETKPEFVASSSDFANFRNWTQVASVQGSSPSLGEAHKGNDENATRTIYVKDNVEREADGNFPVGTLIVKDTKDADGNTIEVTAMVKRGNDFNPTHNDWEWFMLTPDGNIMEDNGMIARGAMLMDGMCGACHTQVKNNDFVFSK